MKKGFTLIELLAVIIILAVIAFITVPVVLGIINNSREETRKRSIDLYGKAVETAIAMHLKHEDTVIENFEDIKKYIEYNGAKVECDIFKVYSDYTFRISNCKVDNVVVEDYYYGTDTICWSQNVATEGEYTYGDEYVCDPGDGILRTFYVLEDGDTTTLTKTDGKVNYNGDGIGTASKGEVSLIMNEDIGESAYASISDIEHDIGKNAYPACYYDEDETCVDWFPVNKFGPITANKYLKQQTIDKGWIVETYLPTYDQLYAINNSEDLSSNSWLINLSVSQYGYWTMTAHSSYQYAWVVVLYYNENRIIESFATTDWNDIGVRPVITISKDAIK